MLEHGSTLFITQNLAQALPFLAQVCETGYLWIDQLCINQGNLIERGHQVKQMGHIYHNCQRVLIWLGTDLYSHTTFRKLCQMAVKAIVPASEPEPRLPINALRSEPGVWRLAGWLASLSKEQQNELCELTRNPWFRRTWVLQEFALAPYEVLVLGDLQLSYPQVLGLATAMLLRTSSEGNSAPDDQADLLRHMELIGIIRDGKRPFRPQLGGVQFAFITTLRNIVSNTKCSDHRDLVYGLMGLDGSHSIGISPDYTAKLADVFTSVTYEIIKSTGELGILDRVMPNSAYPWDASSDTVEELSLPSWVPDYRLPQTMDLDSGWLPVLPELVFPPMSYPNRVHLGYHDGILRLRGNLVDTIVACRRFDYTTEYGSRQLASPISPIAECDEILESCGAYDWVQQAFAENLRDTVPLPSIPEILFSCIFSIGTFPEARRICEAYCEDKARSSSLEHQTTRDGFHPPIGNPLSAIPPYLRIDTDLKPRSIITQSGDSHSSFVNERFSSVHGKWSVYPREGSLLSLFLTARGKLGLALNPQEGDRLAFLHGHPIKTVLLRPCLNGRNHFRWLPQNLSRIMKDRGVYGVFWDDEPDDIFLV
jgi:hypothetical protein